jgi:hypothetical protein
MSKRKSTGNKKESANVSVSFSRQVCKANLPLNNFYSPEIRRFAEESV